MFSDKVDTNIIGVRDINKTLRENIFMCSVIRIKLSPHLHCALNISTSPPLRRPCRYDYGSMNFLIKI